MIDKITPIQKAEQYCADNQLRFTQPRQFVLEILFNNKKPMGAYDILKELGRFIDTPKPPTAYRAIDFWREHGFVHKIESLNTYMACCTNHEDHAHDINFLVCNDCNTVDELHTHPEKNNHLPKGFIAKRQFTEIHGTCETCSQKN